MHRRMLHLKSKHVQLLDAYARTCSFFPTSLNSKQGTSSFTGLLFAYIFFSIFIESVVVVGFYLSAYGLRLALHHVGIFLFCCCRCCFLGLYFSSWYRPAMKYDLIFIRIRKVRYKWIRCIRTTHTHTIHSELSHIYVHWTMCGLTFFVLATGAIATFVKCICVCTKTRAQCYSNLNVSICWISRSLVPHRRSIVALINYCNSFLLYTYL